MKTKPKTKLNVRLLRRIQKHILEEPERLFMTWYLKQGEPGSKFSGDNGSQLLPKCGTAACIAGWACLLSGCKDIEVYEMLDESRNVLRLPDGYPSINLFNYRQWPEPFSGRYDKATRPLQRAKIAAARIEHLIQHGE